jgi:hypothetical protein
VLHRPAELADVPPEEISWQRIISTAIEYQSRDQFEAAVHAYAQEQQAMYRATATALADRNLLIPFDVQESVPGLLLVLEDAPGKGFEPIPRFSLPSRVE